MIFGPQQHDKSVCVCLCGVKSPKPTALRRSITLKLRRKHKIFKSQSLKSLPLKLGRSQELILAEMHSLDDVSAVVEDAANVLRVHCAREVWITIVAAITACCADPLRR